jgi:hypothetical protein
VPNFAESPSNLGNDLRAADRFAGVRYRRAIALRPEVAARARMIAPGRPRETSDFIIAT